MKRCPTCKRTYEDDTLSFCLEDGTPLAREVPPAADSDATLVSPSRPAEGYDQSPGQPTVAARTPPLVPPPYSIPGAPPPPQRKVWPWVVGIVSILFILIVMAVAAVVIIPQLGPRNTNVNLPEPSPLPTSTPEVEYEPTPSESTPVEENDVPTDEDEVLAQLKQLENEWEEANVTADKEALDRILADEYKSNNGTKQDYLNSIQPSPGRRWRYSDFEVTLDGDRAILTYKLDRITDEATNSYTFVDTFVWRDHRWQATGSRSVRLQ